MRRNCTGFTPPVPVPSPSPPARRALSSPRPPAASATPPAAAGVDKLMARLSHVNKNLRARAAGELAKMPPADVVPLLLAQLDVTETNHRRAAVQALGMVGMPAVAPLVELLLDSEEVIVRASCSKALAGVAMFYPRERAAFDDGALEAMGGLVSGGVVDPVTKIATVGCLTMLACDTEVLVGSEGVGADMSGGDGYRAAAASERGTDRAEVVPGNERAVQMLTDMLLKGEDIALAANVCGALAQVANCGTAERKAEIIAALKKIAEGAESDDEESGYGYVREMCRGHLEQLEGKDQS